MEFKKFPPIGRLNKVCTITEKIDGTNGLIKFDENGEVLVGSRKKEIFPEKSKDNFGFAKWVHEHREALFAYIGEGEHYGEWAGAGIGRRYGLKEKRFFLFNFWAFGTEDNPIPKDLLDAGLRVVPIIYRGPFSTEAVADTMISLSGHSIINPDFERPEGIVIYHHAIKFYGKVTFEHDEGKWAT